MTITEKKLGKHLSIDSLYKLVKTSFDKIKESNASKKIISLSDVLMSGFSIFALKEPSLLSFDERRMVDQNLKSIFHINKIPSDTQIRKRLDPINPKKLQSLYKDVFRQLQRGKVLEKMQLLDGHYLLSLDGTEYYSSNKIHCNSCLEKKNKKTKKITYHHMMLGASIVHPDYKEVLPLSPEPIIKQDGEKKNDCERNAGKRFIKQLRKDHPHLKLIIIEDSLSSNAPHIKELQKNNLRYILNIKEGDHTYLFNHVKELYKNGSFTEHECKVKDIVHKFRYIKKVPLNGSNKDLLQNFIEYWEIGPKKTQHFSWVTDLNVTKGNVYTIMRGGRARWKIENETFNTLKNQGYNFEHNFGHGKKNLSVILANLMMIAFLVDQSQQLADELFRSVWKKLKTKKALWERIRGLFILLEFDSMKTIYKALLYGFKVNGFAILNNTS